MHWLGRSGEIQTRVDLAVHWFRAECPRFVRSDVRFPAVPASWCISINPGPAARPALAVRYGQLHAVEVSAAGRVAAALCAREHRVVELDLCMNRC